MHKTISTILLIFIFKLLSAQTTIDGDVWRKNDSPHHVTGNIVVVDLIIEPGVTVYFDDNYTFEVDSILTASGFFSDSIYFKPDPANSNGWGGISFNPNASASVLKYCRIEGANNQGININTSSPSITNCRIVNNDNGIKINDTQLDLFNCDINNMIDNGVWLNNAKINLQNSVIANNGYNGILSTHLQDTLNLINSVIAHNVVTGVISTVGKVNIKNSIVYYNANQIGSTPSQTDVTYSCIEGGHTGSTNIDSLPNFLNTTNYLLSNQSPCIDAGDDSTVFNDLYFPPSLGGNRNDIGAYGGPFAGLWYPPVVILPDSIDFGIVSYDSSKTMGLEIKNYRDITINVDSVKFDGLNSHVFNANNNSFIVPVLNSTQLSVTFTPDSQNVFNADLKLKTQNHGFVNSFVTGEGVVAEINLQSNSLDFNTVDIGDSSTLGLPILNSGHDTLKIHQIYATNSVFNLQDTTLKINPYDSRDTLLVTFFPDSAINYLDSLILFSNDPANRRLAVSLLGEGFGAVIGLNQQILNFGSTSLNSDSLLNLTISNYGNDSLLLQNIQIDSVYKAFKLDNDSLVFPIIVKQDSSYILPIRFSPYKLGLDSALVQIENNDGIRSIKTAGLFGNGIAPVIELSDSLVEFGTIPLLTQLSQSLNIYNSGQETLIIYKDSLKITGSDSAAFFIDSLNTDIRIFPGDTATINPGFRASQTGSKHANLQIISNDPLSPAKTVTLTGNSLAPDIAISDSTMNFGTILVSTDSSRELTIYNHGSGTLIIYSDSLVISGPDSNVFSTDILTSDLFVQPDSSLKLIIRFNTPEVGNKQAILQICSNDSAQPKMLIDLSGTGVLPLLSLSTDSLSFGTITALTQLSQKLYIYNIGNQDTLIILTESLLITGSDSNAFSIDSNYSNISIQPGDTLGLDITFSAFEPGLKQANLQIISNDPLSHTTYVTLTGNSLAPDMAVSDTTINFGSVPVSTDSSRELYIYNRGVGPLIIYHDSLKISGPDSNVFSTDSLTSDLFVQPDSSLKLNIRFNTPVVGNKQATLQICSNDTSQLKKLITLEGTGVSSFLALSDTTLNFGTIPVNTHLSQKLLIYNTGDLDTLNINTDSLLITGSGLDAFSFDSSFSNISIPPKDSLDLEIIFTAFEPGSKQANLQILSNDPIHPKVGVKLIGNSIAPIIVLSMPNIDFGRIPVSSDSSQNLIVYNEGNGKLIIYPDSLKIAGNDTNAFSIQNVAIDSIINPGDSLILDLRFSTIHVGPKTAILQIGSNDTQEEIELTGIATDNDTATFLFDQNNSSNEFIMDQAGVLSFYITANSPIDSAKLLLRRGGKTIYSSIPFVKQGSTDFWEAQIDSNLITERGLEYYIQANHGWTSTDMPQNGVMNPNIILVEIPQIQFPKLTKKEIYQKISIPFASAGQTLKELFEDELGVYNDDIYRIFDCLDGENYTELVNMDTQLPPGKALWLITKDEVSLDISDGQSVTTKANFSLQLTAGWNMISTPFAFPVNWADVDTLHHLRFYDGADWPPASVLEPYKGYAVKVTDDTSISIPAKEAGTPTALPKPNLFTGADWSINLVAKIAKSKDEYNYAGTHKSARSDVDRFDSPEPPPIGDFISLYFLPEDQKTNPAEQYSTDFRNMGEQGYIYDFEILSNIAGKKSIDIKTTNLPDDFHWMVLAPETKVKYTDESIFTTSKYSKYKLIVGTEEFITEASKSYLNLPVVFKLNQNYPNPFNPTTTIKYQLPKQTNVSIDIFNILGQKINSLLKNKQKEAGYFQVKWDGTNYSGKKVATGLYFLQLSTKEFSKAVKMILQR